MDWLVLAPPVVILVIALFTHNIILSILLGIGSACLVATNGAPIAAGLLAYHSFYAELKWSNVPVYGFLIVLGAIVALINQTGGICRFSQLFANKLRSAKAVESASLITSLLLGIDDYLSALTTGCVIKPFADQQRIARVKLAFLLDAIASPIVVLVPISSWIALIVRELSAAGVNISTNASVQADPFYVYLKSIPYIFYSFIIIGCAWFIVRKRISYGPMHQQEVIAQQTGNLFGGQPPRFKGDAQTPVIAAHASLIDFIVPIGSLLLFTAIGLPYYGGYWLFGGTYGLLESFTHVGDSIFNVLMDASISSFALSCIVAITRKSLQIKQVPQLLWTGLSLMYNSIIIIFCALIFGNLLRDNLHTGQYLATLILPYIPGALLPLLIFAISTVTALAVGSSWGTIGISIPIALPIIIASAQQTGMPIIYALSLAVGAILSGAVAGAQLSLISDPVTIASTSSGCYQIDHVKTQSWYLAPALVGTCCAFMASIFLPLHGALNGFASSATGLAVSIGLLYGVNRWQKTR